MRDNQRQKVYDSEHGVDHGKTFVTVEECQAYVDRVLTRKRLQTKFSRFPKQIEVHPGVGRRIACAQVLYGMRVIKLPKWARTELVILHEIAHHVAQTDGRDWAHSWKFCHIHLALVREMMGREVETALRSEFRQRRVRYTEPRTKRPLSEEQRVAAADRLAAAREARLGERGRWALRTNGGAWVKRISWKFETAYPTFTGMAEEAQVWTTRPAVDRWIERLSGHSWGIEIVDLSKCSAAVR